MASMKGTRLPKCVVLGELVGRQEKKWMGCFLDVLRTFGINADERERRRTAEQGAEYSMAKWIYAYSRFFFWMKSTLYVLLPDGVFYFVTTCWTLASDLVRIQSINQSKPGSTYKAKSERM